MNKKKSTKKTKKKVKVKAKPRTKKTEDSTEELIKLFEPMPGENLEPEKKKFLEKLAQDMREISKPKKRGLGTTAVKRK